LTSLRDMVSERHRSKKSSLVEIYRHFDRDGKGYFNAQDFQEATSDLRIETSNRVADMAITQIALDGHDKVCYGEFLVFIHDVDHKSLEQFVQNQMAQQYERQGKSFPNDFHAYFFNEERKNRGIRGNVNFQEDEQDDFVDIKAFVSILQKLGLKLETVDVNRLVTRFDVSGGGKTCSAGRFVRMVEGCEVWKKAEDVLRNQEEVGLEADTIRCVYMNLCMVYAYGTHVRVTHVRVYICIDE
jgi:Ca2+-binding EF-hand superfamily protein